MIAMGEKKQEVKTNSKRGQIVEMAGKMFMSEGYGAISMDKLAEAVPVSKRTLYNNFKDKAEIFGAVMENRCQTIFNKLEQSIKDHRNVEETLMNMGEQFLTRVLEPSAVNIYRVAITESRHFPELSKLFYAYGPKRGSLLLAGYFEELTKQGKLKIENPELAARVFVGMLCNRIQMEFMLGIKKSITAKEKSEIVKYAVKVFLYGHQK